MADLICMEKLEEDVKKINGDQNISAAKARRLTVDHIYCFIQYARQQSEVEKMLDTKYNEIIKRLEAMEKRSQDRMSFKWMFFDKVLPSLITAAILSIVTWALVVNQHIQVSIP